MEYLVNRIASELKGLNEFLRLDRLDKIHDIVTDGDEKDWLPLEWSTVRSAQIGYAAGTVTTLLIDVEILQDIIAPANWLSNKDDVDYYECSNCRYSMYTEDIYDFRYCPCCGKKMRVGGTENESE